MTLIERRKEAFRLGVILDTYDKLIDMGLPIEKGMLWKHFIVYYEDSEIFQDDM